MVVHGSTTNQSAVLTADWIDKPELSAVLCLYICLTADTALVSFLSFSEGILDFTCFLSFFFLALAFFFFRDFSSGTSGSDSLSLSLDLLK